ncbi:malto-oligosyltrehalose trehalohydrolase [Myxococcota bacterium]|nr:malto-oligosyltrehalose trehalohydrolase [Myxococcota bacterium]MCZ7618223.1 malto-oligosyltrehalose trehalohydrolase [Myxococcota bacterium]
MPFGAAVDGSSTRFRLWAPDAGSVALHLEGPEASREIAMTPHPDGWFETRAETAGPGTRYRYRIDGEALVPDPASRFQPEGVHGPSEVVDPRSHVWRDGHWRGRPWPEAVLYEFHVGTGTANGRFDEVIEQLDDLVALGVTGLALMPLAECPGAHNWGYDGVYPFAPEAAYGRPEALKRLVEAAHERGLMVLLDVVYNHFGPEGNYLSRYASPFFTHRYETPWGAAIDFEGPRSRPVREFFIHNALFWLEEYSLDGLRLDAVHAIHDASRPDLLAELAQRVRSHFDGVRDIHLVLENDRNEAHRLRRTDDAAPVEYTAQWNDDLHHALHVLLTGEREGYYEDYADRPIAHLGRALAEGFAWQGEPSPHRGGRPRGAPSGFLPPTAFLAFLQNHDQIGNRAFGERLAALVPEAALRAGTAVLLLAPQIPLLFMGEEWAAREPFPFFCDFGAELAAAVREGRRREFAAFPAFRDPAARERIPDPGAAESFAAARLDRSQTVRPPHAQALALHTELLSLRRRELVPRLHGLGGECGQAEVLGEHTLRVTWRLADGARLQLLAHLAATPGPDVAAPVSGRLLFETPAGATGTGPLRRLPPWSVVWSLLGPADLGPPA